MSQIENNIVDSLVESIIAEIDAKIVEEILTKASKSYRIDKRQGRKPKFHTKIKTRVLK
jgi:hypothetical protein